MEFEAPSIKTLAELREKLKPLNIPIYFNLPDSDVIEDLSVQIDIFLPDDESRGGVERVRSEAIRRIGRNNRMASTVLKDDTIGREVYHIIINVTEIIF